MDSIKGYETDEYDDGEGEEINCIRELFDKRLEGYETRRKLFLGGVGLFVGSVLTYFLYKKRQPKKNYKE